MDKIEKLIDTCKNMKFSLGDYDGMSKAEDIIFNLKQYQRGELDLDMLYKCLSDNGCPYDNIDGINQIELCMAKVERKEQDKQCTDCWKAYLS